MALILNQKQLLVLLGGKGCIFFLKFLSFKGNQRELIFVFSLCVIKLLRNEIKNPHYFSTAIFVK